MAGDKVIDGLTLLKLIVDKINPSTCIGIDNMMKDIESASLAKFDYNVDDMLEFMQDKYNKILEERRIISSLHQVFVQGLALKKERNFHMGHSEYERLVGYQQRNQARRPH